MVKTEGELLISQIENVLDHNEIDLKNLEQDLKNDYLMRAKAASYIVEREPEIEGDVERLREIAKMLQVDQLYLFDATGTIYSGTHPQFNGYNFETGEQIGYFAPMLNNRELEMCQDLTPNTSEGISMMYAMVWRTDGKGMVQVGLSPKRLLETISNNELAYLFSNMPYRQGSVMYVVDKESGQFWGSTDSSYNGKNINEYNVSLPDDLSEPRIFYDMVNGTSYYLVIKEYNGYYIGISQRIADVYRNISKMVTLEALFLILVAVLVISIVSYHESKSREKEMEHKTALESALEKAEAANRAKTSFLFHISHEVRTPMNAILGYVSVAQKHIEDKARVMDSLNKLNDAGEHML